MCSNRTSAYAETTDKVHFDLLADRHINPLNPELNPIWHLLTLLGGATIVVVSRLRVKEGRFELKILDHTSALSSGIVYIVMIVEF